MTLGVNYIDMVNYFEFSKGVDCGALWNYKSI